MEEDWWPWEGKMGCLGLPCCALRVGSILQLLQGGQYYTICIALGSHNCTRPKRSKRMIGVRTSQPFGITICCPLYNYINIPYMKPEEIEWNQLPRLNGTELSLLRGPKNLQEELLLLNAHRHLLHRQIILKGVDECLEYLPSSFSQRALQVQYLALERGRVATPERLPKWKKAFDDWVNFKFTALNSKDSLTEIASIDANFELFDSQEMHTVFLGFIAQDLLRHIVGKHLPLADLEKINFESEPRPKLTLSPRSILQFLDLSVPKTLYHFILRKEQLPQQLQREKLGQCLYSNRQLEFVIRQTPSFSTLIKVLIKAVLANMYDFDQTEQKTLMDIVFRYFYLHHSKREHSAVQLFILCFNHISEPVRYAMTEDFVLFLNVARKIGREKMVEVLLQKSVWLKEIHEKTKEKRIIGYKLEGMIPYNRYNFGEQIRIQRGNVVSRYFECIDDHSILFLRVSLEEHNIKMKIMFAGAFDSTDTSNFKPICFEKVEKDFLQTIILPQKGIYYIEFDNSFSWIYGKTINFERIIMSPLTFQASTRYPFAQDYYLGMDMNAVTKAHQIEYSNGRNLATVEIIKNEGKFSFLMSKGERGQQINTYEYETDNEERLLEKLKEFVQPITEFSLFLNRKPIKTLEEIKQTPKQPSSSEKPKKQKDVLIEIPLQY